MAFNILPIIKLLSKSGSIAGTVNSLIKQFNTIKNVSADSNDFKKALELQSALNEKLENQINLLQSALEKLHRSIKAIIYIALLALLISIGAMLVAIL